MGVRRAHGHGAQVRRSARAQRRAGRRPAREQRRQRRGRHPGRGDGRPHRRGLRPRGDARVPEGRRHGGDRQPRRDHRAGGQAPALQRQLEHRRPDPVADAHRPRTGRHHRHPRGQRQVPPDQALPRPARGRSRRHGHRQQRRRDRARQRPGGEGLRLRPGRAGGGAGGDPGARPVLRDAHGVPQRLRQRAAHPPDGPRRRPVRPSQGRFGVPGRGQPRAAGDRRGAAGVGRRARHLRAPQDAGGDRPGEGRVLRDRLPRAAHPADVDDRLRRADDRPRGAQPAGPAVPLGDHAQRRARAASGRRPAHPGGDRGVRAGHPLGGDRPRTRGPRVGRGGPAARRGGAADRLDGDPGLRRGHVRRPRPPRPGDGQPALQRDQVHAGRWARPRGAATQQRHRPRST